MTVELVLGTLTSFPTASNINSLSDTQAKPIGRLDNATAKAPSARLYFQATLASSGVSATGTIELWWLASEDDTDWTDGIDPTTTSNIVASLKNARLLAVLNANANSQVVRLAGLDLATLIGDLPPYGSIVVVNRSGAALPASTHAAKYRTVTYADAA